MPSAEGRELPWRARPHGLGVRVRLTPGSSRDAVEGVGPVAEGMAILARVRAVPEKGAANAALERLLASWLGVPANTVVVRSGARSRVKSVDVIGPPGVLERRLAAAVATLPA